MVQARLIKRYKRFLVDVEFTDGRVITAHCPNTGSMRNCGDAGNDVWLSRSDNPKRKYAYTWQIVQGAEGERICIHSALANQIVAEAWQQQLIPEIETYTQMQREVRYGNENSRIDFVFSSDAELCYVEVKCVTYHVGTGLGCFPDAVSQRATRHLRELLAIKEAGHRAVLFFCVQNTAIKAVAAASEIDPKYAETLSEVVAKGVEVLCYDTDISTSSIALKNAIPFKPSCPIPQ